jgi:hypothetical protein
VPELGPPLEVESLEAEPLDGVEADPVDAVPSPPGVPLLAVPVSAPDSDFARALVLADDRSFFAQPEPLKCTVGATNALRSVPSAPQAGQNRGPGAVMPWITSVRSPQFEQR